MTFIVVATWIAKPGEEARVARAISRLIGPSREEAGCLTYQAHRSISDSRTFLIYEEYVDRIAYETHGESEHFQRHAVKDGIPFLESRERSYYNPL